MKNLLKRTVKIFKIKRIVKKEILCLTKNIPCVNLSVSGIKTLKFYNNCDLIAVLNTDDAENLLSLGREFFDCILYSLCKKYSIDNY